MKLLYEDWKENFLVDFKSYPEKYKQVEIAKARWVIIEVIIAVKWWTRKILSNNLFFEN